MVTIFGMPADGVMLFGTCMILVVLGFIVSDSLGSAARPRVLRKRQVQKYQELQGRKPR